MLSSEVLWRAPRMRVNRWCAMKEAIDSMPTERVVEKEGFANRKLIRPSLNRNDHNSNHNQAPMERRERSGSGSKKLPPPETTNAENFYYQKQMQSKTPMVIVLRDGEELHGVIEWYDKHCLKVNRTSQPNIVVYKPAIKYMFKEGENTR
jgi:sRNA-binding regulator protein Hfq